MLHPRIFLGLFLVSCSFSYAACADEIKTDSKITAATVYNDRATLTRIATVEIPAGKHDLVFTGLPISLMPNSLRAGGKSVAKVTFGAISSKVESSLDYIQPKEKELNDKLLALQDQRQVFEAEKQALLAGRKFLDTLGEQAKLRSDEDIAEIDLKPDTWGAAADAVTLKMAENMKASLQHDIQIRNTDNEIRKIHEELSQLRTGQKQSYSVTIPFESAAATSLTVDLSYQLPSVSWQPEYDARLDVKTGKLELVQYGSVWQQTGEDWEGIDLTLSTARPSQGTSLPALETDWVWIEQHMAKAASLRAVAFDAAGAASNMSGMEASPAYIAAVEQQNEMASDRALQKAESIIPVPTEVRADFAPAQINTEGFVGEYKIVGKSTVKSDGTQSKLLVGGFETENTIQIQVKPQFSTEAYLVVKAKLKGDAPILAGQVNLFRDGAFLGQGYIPMMRPDDEQELSFGVDDNVTVRRNTLKDERSEAGLIAKDSVLERNFTTEIQNLHKEPIQIAVLETIPVPQDQRIRVEILPDVTTAGYEADLHDVKGVTRWIVPMEAGAKTNVNLGWRVSWPKGENISGI